MLNSIATQSLSPVSEALWIVHVADMEEVSGGGQPNP